MTTNRAIYDFLVSDNNLQYAQELSRDLDIFQKDMHKQFWSKYNQLMTLRIASSEVNIDWAFHPFTTKKLLTDWGGCHFSHNNYPKSKVKLSLSMCQESRETNFRLAYTLDWGVSKTEVNFNGSSLINLSLKLADYKISIPGSYSLLFGYSQWRIYDPDFLTKIYKDVEVFCQTIVDHNWKMFLDLRPLLEKVNEDVSTLNYGES